MSMPKDCYKLTLSKQTEPYLLEKSARFLILRHLPKLHKATLTPALRPQSRNLKPRPTARRLRQQPQLMRLTPYR